MTDASPHDLRALAPMRNITPTRPRKAKRPFTLRLWIPIAPLALLLSPFALLAIPVLALVGPLGRRNWTVAIFDIGAALLALHGTQVEIRTPDFHLSIDLF